MIHIDVRVVNASPLIALTKVGRLDLLLKEGQQRLLGEKWED